MSNNKKNEISLDKYRGNNSKIYSGRNEGEMARKVLQLHNIDSDGEVYKILIPKGTWSINSSFFLGLFGESIRELGESAFKQKYIFVCDAALEDDIDEGIKDALKNNNALE